MNSVEGFGKRNTPLKLNFSLHVIIEVGDALITISEYINLAFKEYETTLYAGNGFNGTCAGHRRGPE